MSCECDNPIKTTCIPQCVEQLCGFSIEDVSQDLYAYIHDVTINKTYRLDTSSSFYGNVCVDVSDIRFAQDHDYHLWLTKDTEGIDDKLVMTIDDVELNCIQLVFTRVVSVTDRPQEYVNHTISLDVEDEEIKTFQSMKATLTSAQLLALHTTSVILVPAPGVGKTIKIISLFESNRAGAIAYVGGQTHYFYIGEDADYLSLDQANLSSPLTSANNASSIGNPSAGISGFDKFGENLPLKVKTNSQTTLGNGEVDIYIIYKIVTL